MPKRLQSYLLIVVLCIMPGLTPFYPEPHLFGKIRWLLGDASTMQPIDWFDLLLHGPPFIALLFLMVGDLRKRFLQK